MKNKKISKKLTDGGEGGHDVISDGEHSDLDLDSSVAQSPSHCFDARPHHVVVSPDRASTPHEPSAPFCIQPPDFASLLQRDGGSDVHREYSNVIQKRSFDFEEIDVI